MSIENIMIPIVDAKYTQQHIADVFWKQQILKVSSITLLPFTNKKYCKAYIKVAEWCENEAANLVIRGLRNPNNVETLINHDNNQYWKVVDCDIKMENQFPDYICHFVPSYFKDPYSSSVLETEKECPIWKIINDTK